MKNLRNFLKKINWLNVVQLIAISAIALIPLLEPVMAQAQLPAFQCPTGLNCESRDVNSFIRTIINWVLSITLGVAVLFLVIGGFRYVISAGNEDAAEAGKNTVFNALIGIVIIVLSYVIVNVVANLVSRGGGTSN